MASTLQPSHRQAGYLTRQGTDRTRIKAEICHVDSAFAEHFANDWIAAWNAHDLDRVLSHYAD